jgi:hypothetical protein
MGVRRTLATGAISIFVSPILEVADRFWWPVFLSF